MNKTVFILGMAILATALAALLLFGDSDSVAGLAPDSFASLAALTAIAVLVGSALVGGRMATRPKLWHAAVWLAVLVALMAGYRAFH